MQLQTRAPNNLGLIFWSFVPMVFLKMHLKTCKFASKGEICFKKIFWKLFHFFFHQISQKSKFGQFEEFGHKNFPSVSAL